MKKSGRRVKRMGRIPDAVSIEQRPQEINARKIIGHWETDNLIGKITDKAAISTTVERVIKYTILSRLKNKTAEEKRDVLVRRLINYPEELRRSLTTDNGSENDMHKEITSALKALMYFCHSYASWEKGTVENTNGRIRRFIPKGKSIDTMTDIEIAAVEYQLNHTPRKILGYYTPDEMMERMIQKIKYTRTGDCAKSFEIINF